jgi:hypothetical protein
VSEPIRTEAVYVVFTGAPETRAAVSVARDLSRAIGAALTVVDFCRARRLDREFSAWLRQSEITARTRVFVCRRPREAFAFAFRPHSLIVLGGRRRWWPTPSMRLRHALERAGHFVLFIDAREKAAHAS